MDHREEWLRRSEASREHTRGTNTSRPCQTVKLVRYNPNLNCPGAPNTRYVQCIMFI